MASYGATMFRFSASSLNGLSARGLVKLARQPGRQPLHPLRGQVDAVAAYLHAVHGPGEGAVGAELAAEVQHPGTGMRCDDRAHQPVPVGHPDWIVLRIEAAVRLLTSPVVRLGGHDNARAGRTQQGNRSAEQSGQVTVVGRVAEMLPPALVVVVHRLPAAD